MGGEGSAEGGNVRWTALDGWRAEGGEQGGREGWVMSGE